MSDKHKNKLGPMMTDEEVAEDRRGMGGSRGGSSLLLPPYSPKTPYSW